MRIKTFGWRDNLATSQMPRIDQAFTDVGCRIVYDEPVFAIYAHDSSVYNEAIKYKEKYPESLLLLKVLDIPEHIFPHFNTQEFTEKLKKADKILANSQFVKKQIKKWCGLDSYVVLDIPKNIENNNISFNDKRIDYFAVGRLRDSNKRGHILLEVERSSQALCVSAGTETIGNIHHLGVVTDDELNHLYNNSKFILCMGKNEGIQLQIIEGFLGGSFPLVASDSTTANEFCPKDFHVEPNAQSIIDKSKEISSNLDKYKKIADDWAIELAQKFHPHQVIRNILKATNPF